MHLQNQKLKSQYVYADGMRFYKFDEQRQYPGVTTILGKTKPEKDRQSLANWAKRVGEEEAKLISQSAIVRGHKLHKLIETYLETRQEPDLSEFSDEVQGMWGNGLRLIQDIAAKSKLLGLEMPVYSDAYQYAGTFDCLVYVNKQVKLLDWKTSTQPKQFQWINDYCLQMAAYSQAIAEIYGEKYRPQSATIVIFLQNKAPQIFKLENYHLNKYWSDFEERLNYFKMILGMFG